MATRHRPSKNLQNILANLLNQAESNPGEPARRRLSNNLQVDIKVTKKDCKTHLQISRSGRYPGESEWRSILRHWPYPVSVQPKEFNHGARCYLRAEWPTQQRLV
jgi:hypothetical protein